jgi:hypothetical protein
MPNITKEANGRRRRRLPATPNQLVNLLRLRLKDLDTCIGRIEGINRSLRDFGIRVPVRLLPLPDRRKVIDAFSDAWDWKPHLREQSQQRRTRRSNATTKPPLLDRWQASRRRARNGRGDEEARLRARVSR